MRRRKVDQATIAKLYETNRNLVDQLEKATSLADARYDLLKAVYRENEALRVELIARKPLLPQRVDTAPMARQRSLTPTPVIDLTQPGDETQLMMQPGWSA